MSIRENNTPISKYKTTAKLATAAILEHNIITTYESSVVDILPSKYPFILKDAKIKTIKNMIDLVIKDYNSDKKLWNEGLKIMSHVKQKLSIKQIIKKYTDMIETMS